MWRVVATAQYIGGVSWLITRGNLTYSILFMGRARERNEVERLMESESSYLDADGGMGYKGIIMIREK